MPNPRELINIPLAKGRKHLIQEEIQRRVATESTAPADDTQLPEYLSKKQWEEFSALAKELQRIKIIGNMDTGEPARYVVAYGFCARYTKLLCTLPKKKRVRPRELRAKLTAEEGRAVAVGKEIDDEGVVLELKHSLALPQGKYSTQCEATTWALGFSVTNRCKSVIPQGSPVLKSNKLERFRKQTEGE